MLLEALGYQFIPFLITIFMAAEIFVRDPRNPLNRVTMTFFLSFGANFFGDFLMQILPLDTARTAQALKLSCTYYILASGLYFFMLLSRTVTDKRRRILIAIVPLLGLINFLNPMDKFHFEILQEGQYRLDALSEPFMLVMYSIVAYGMICVAWIARRVWKSPLRQSDQERRRIRVIMRGSLLCCLWIAVTAVAMPWIAPYVNFPVTTISSYGVLIFIFHVRHAMVNYAFLSTAARRYQILFTQSTSAIVLIDHMGRLVELNPAATSILALNAQGPDWRLQPIFHFIHVQDEDLLNRMREAVGMKMPLQVEVPLSTKGGDQIFADIRLDYIEVEGNFWTYITANDITLQKTQKAALMDLAFRDPLTGLMNRRACLDALANFLEALRLKGNAFAVYLLDLDRFKKVNDTLGHAAGDELLKEIANRLTHAAPQHAHVARMGGDEFVVVVGLEPFLPPEQIAARIQNELDKPIYIKGQHCDISASIGYRICMKPEDSLSVETVLHDADEAMYQEKVAGKTEPRRS